jgi:hypothetical protein
MLRYLLGMCVVLWSAVSMQAQPCTWVSPGDKITELCGPVGIGTSAPWGGLHVKGLGQASASPELTSTTGQHGSTLFLQDTGGDVANGGMIAFGAAQGHFAAIKGHINNGTLNTTGGLLFLTRNTTSDTTLTERMRLFGNGHLAIGTTADTARLHIVETSPSAWALNVDLAATISANGNTTGYGQVIGANYNVLSGITNTGNAIGIHVAATNSGSGTLTQTVGQVLYSGATGGGTVSTAYGSVISLVGPSVATGFGLLIEDIQATTGYAIYQSGTNDLSHFAGKVGIGTNSPAYPLHVVGNVRIDGQLTGTNIQAQYQDVAEWVPSTEDLAPGTVVVIDPSIDNTVVKSTRAYDMTVAGVVSAQPGIILGTGSASKEQIATTGRVRVKVDATAVPIRIGDLLVTSDKPGMAMKSLPIEMGGAALHRPGTIVGKALEALPGGEGEILVLLSLQ